MQTAPTIHHVASAMFALLLACGGGGSKSDTDTDSTTGEDTFGMGETSATPTDPTTPTTSASSASSITSASTVTSASDVTGDPTLSTTTTTDPSGPDTITVSASGTVTSDPTATTEETTMPVDCQDPPGQPQDFTCVDASGCGCASGDCFLIPILGGWCGECLVDADCPDGGCTTPNPVASVGAVCNLGKPGDGCQTDAVCHDPAFAKCSPVLKVDGILTVATCGACKTNADCAQGVKNCTPVYDLENFAGMFECVPDGSVPNDEGCNLQPAGDQPIGNKACQSGFCGEASIMGLVKLGVCGQCNVDAHCGPGKTCTEALVDLNTNQLFGSTCL